MIDTLRRAFNTIDRLFDRHAISQETHFTQDGGEARHPETALPVFARTQPVARSLDRQARLKAIVSQQGVRGDGTSAHWEFFFDLPRRRAQAICEWALSWDEALDTYGPVRINVTLRPFPPADSPYRHMVREGKMLHRQLSSLWQREYRRRPNLPHRFRDTDAAVADFIHQGLDVTQAEFSLSTGYSLEGRPCWIAQARRTTYQTDFE